VIRVHAVVNAGAVAIGGGFGRTGSDTKPAGTTLTGLT
jgi:hypothetical protein